MVETLKNSSSSPSETPQETENPTRNIEDCVTALENSLVETNGYLQRILAIMQKVTIIDDHEKYSFQPSEPGVLASKPIPAGATNKHSGEPSFNTETNFPNRTQNNNQQSLNLCPKIELQFFDGDNPRSRVRKCDKFFTIFSIPDASKVEIASMYLVGRAETWFTDKLHADVIKEFNKLHQTSSVEDYQECFEALQPFMLQLNAQLGEAYFVSSFISGLKDDIRHKVRVHEPQTLADACRKAKLYELAMEIEVKKPKFPYKYSSTQPQSTHRVSNFQPTSQPKCGDKFTPGHQCKPKQLNMMETNDSSQVSDNEELYDTKEPLVTTNEEVTDPLEISMNALTGCVGYNTIRIPGSIKGRPLSILVDSESTHSFVTAGWAKEGVELIQTHPLSITVANGDQLHSTAIIKGSDMVLGVDWMRKYSPITMDFNKMTLQYLKEEQPITLQGGIKNTSFKIISGEKMQKMTSKNPEFLGELYFLSIDAIDSTTSACLQPLLEQYKSVIDEPKGLPPQRTQDHAISLIPGAQPVNLRPYRFPFSQKSEIEKQIGEMLAASIVQNSKSPFASPCLLVKKKDGTWRLCVDYQQLNSLTIKNKYPITVVDDLLDELSGAKYYSKLDLRYGYWQIRIIPEDVPKTAFRTHHGHFEFKIMPFGLTNAPATFQSLMNEIFSPYLQKFVLVFFDDILIYSLTLADHYSHLQQVLQVLETNSLFARKSKCFFGQEKVEYLGHIISSEGVATDPSKVEAMRNWKLPKSIKSLRRFLGLTGYYKKFIRNYGSISKLLTAMLKKDNFFWTQEAKDAFLTLKESMCSASVLALPDFTQPFSLETDASTKGIRAALTQNGRLIAYLSKALGTKNSDLSIYEKNYIAILMAVTKWRHYLEGRPRRALQSY
ncbi:hypothetical protein V6N11_073987 [Hibiscus sabdariffa]|uniref:Reverse transcriptase domain-containing protein n=1 Tax=Hibiscus sabdariffa TaxID=183260 RepID=A0ABR2P5L3_9ROSI